MDNLGGSPVYYKDGSWFHRIKELTDTLEIVYSEKGGFKTEEDAAESYVIELGTFKRKMDILKERQGNLYFKDYLIYWFHKVFIPRSSNITNVVSSYTLYNFLLPSITEKENIQIQFVTVSMVDKILSKNSVFSETSEEQTQKLLSAVFYDAQNEQYEDYICIGMAGNIKSDSTLNSALSNICTNTGLPKITCHSLRHMCAILMFESGGDLLQVAKFLGHANLHTTFDIYVNHMESYGNLKNQLNGRFDPFPLIDGGLSYAEKIV